MAKKSKSTKAGGGAGGGTFADRVQEIAAPPPAAREHPAPVAMSAVLGQEHAVGILRAAMNADRVHHAWIFHGPRGVGKFTTALAFAAMILDPTTAPGLTGELEPDPDSAVARLLRAGTHPDLHVITKELAEYSEEAKVRDGKQKFIVIDLVREFLVEPASMAANLPGSPRISKVFIIDEAELLNTAAQNAALKTLEEPDGKTVVILVTSSPERLLPTIRSRSQQVRFGPLNPAAMKKWVGAWANAQTEELDRDEAAWLIDFAEGSPGEFVSGRAVGLYAWWKELSPMLAGAARGKYALALGPKFAELIDAQAAAVVAANPQASKESATRAAAGRMFRLVSRFYRDQLRGGLPRNVDSSFHDGACRAIDAVRRAETLVDSQVNLTFVGEWLSAELVAASEA